ncbi:azurin [Kangiella koreensis]|uniref:Azurin n=1 Tax=Kangiella koreensis (strain DSM 16069 / JCM 12317 / KCTC 12182 / SW-125) TaxID=523791 RepID=C7RCE9_KANKD|nr:azurin [Kangiella koreensis]ACV26941.1 azurin [Kangiella koreensis DSM 16069]
MRKILLTVVLALFALPLFAKDVVVNSDDAMKFDVSEIKVKAGEEIKLTLNHTGKLGKDVMGHNFVVLAQGTDVQAFSNAAIQAKANDYIPEGNDSVLAHTKVIGGGESDTISFTLKEKGTYEFICSFPGHSFMMKGVIIVE